MLYLCERCGYSTQFIFNFQRHERRIRPCKNKNTNNTDQIQYINNSNNFTQNAENVALNAENVALNAENVALNAENVALNAENVTLDSVNYKCTCGKIFIKKYNYNQHINTCKGVDSLTCEICFKKFNDRKSKFKHMKKNNCESPLNNTNNTINNITNNTTNNTININNTIINNNIIVNFGEENIEMLRESKEFKENYNYMIEKKLYGALDCLNFIFFNDDYPEHKTLRKYRRNDIFVEVKENGEWKQKSYDHIHRKISMSLKDLFFPEMLKSLIDGRVIDDLDKTNEYIENLQKFCEDVQNCLDWNTRPFKSKIPHDVILSEKEKEIVKSRTKNIIKDQIYKETLKLKI